MISHDGLKLTYPPQTHQDQLGKCERLRYLLVAICAEYELCLEAILDGRAKRSGDKHVENVIKKWGRIQSKRMKIGDLSGHLGAFGADYKDAFDNRIVKATDTTPIVAWDSIQNNRHLVAHSTGSGITLADLEKFYSDSQQVLDAVAASMGFTPAEIAALTW